MMRILHVTSECYPFVKTGGLADAVSGLAWAFAEGGDEVAVLLPAYRKTIPADAKPLGKLSVAGAGRVWPATLWEARLTRSAPPSPVVKRRPVAVGRGKERPIQQISLRVWFLDIPELYDRDGTPYCAPDGRDWWDNGERFAVLARAGALVALGSGDLLNRWRADVVHSHDWQTGLTAAMLQVVAAERSLPLPHTVFTIHNATFQGWFPESLFWALGLPAHWWDYRWLEAWGQMNFLKAGVTVNNEVTTVSPSYAQELLNGVGDYGLAGALQVRANEGHFRGIVNGIDLSDWNPAADPHLVAPLAPHRGFAAAKRRNRAALLAEWGAEGHDDAPVIGFVGRLTEQKGVDWLIESAPQWLSQTTLRLVLLGSGEKGLEAEVEALAHRFPDRVFVRLGYDERLAHRIFGGSDLFVMPSRFEPCGLAQLYAMHYGAVPVAHAVGGLRDTVIDASLGEEATGFLFTEGESRALSAAIVRAWTLWRTQLRRWRRLVANGMERDFSWQARRAAYDAIYRRKV
jgi:starch synthase